MALTKVTKSGLANDSVDADKLEDGTIVASDINDGTITNAKLAGSIENAKLANSSITINGSAISLGGSVDVKAISWQSVKTSDFTAVAGEGYFVDTTSSTITATLPASPSIGDIVAIKDYAGTFGTNELTIDRNGSNIQGNTNNSLISTNRASVVLVYVDATKGWLYTNESNVGNLIAQQFIIATGGTITTSGDYKIHSFTSSGCFSVSQSGLGSGPNAVDYLVVAGGGGAGGDLGAAGGAGGFRVGAVCSPSAPPLSAPGGLTVSATTYPITVGSGGAGNTGTSRGASGSNSTFSTITSAGGGGGAGDVSDSKTGASGGSGGGNQSNTSRTSGNTPPVSPPQGNAGGLGSPGSSSGGGGGATAQGSDSPSTYQGGAGGNGAPVTGIFGASPQPFYGPTNGVYAGGGGGGSYPSGFGTSPASGGTGGGGPGSNTPGGAGTAGTGNTGGGGGGGSSGNGDGANGGSGVVLIRYKYQ